jgi:ferredoxin-nitrite reductase
MKLETTSADFSDEQKRYLEGFMSGLQVGRVGRGIGVAAGAPAGKVDPEPVGPDAAGFKAQDSSSASSIRSMPMSA